jgi:hypothetical protein
MSFDEPRDPAFDAVSEGGGGESEGFELAEEELIEHASHGNEGGTARITQDASDLDEELDDEDLYGDADEEVDEDL